MPRDDALGHGVLRFSRNDLEWGVALRVTRDSEPPPHLFLAASPGLGSADVGSAAVLELESLDGLAHDPPWVPNSVAVPTSASPRTGYLVFALDVRREDYRSRL
jgi:hypothetical protein